MLAWLVLLALTAVEVGALTWWLRKEFYRVLFNGWALLIYASVAAGDLLVAWLVSLVAAPEAATALGALTLLGAAVAIVVLLGTVFVRWIVKSNI